MPWNTLCWYARSKESLPQWASECEPSCGCLDLFIVAFWSFREPFLRTITHIHISRWSLIGWVSTDLPFATHIDFKIRSYFCPWEYMYIKTPALRHVWARVHSRPFPSRIPRVNRAMLNQTLAIHNFIAESAHRPIKFSSGGCIHCVLVLPCPWNSQVLFLGSWRARSLDGSYFPQAKNESELILRDLYSWTWGRRTNLDSLSQKEGKHNAKGFHIFVCYGWGVGSKRKSCQIAFIYRSKIPTITFILFSSCICAPRVWDLLVHWKISQLNEGPMTRVVFLNLVVWNSAGDCTSHGFWAEAWIGRAISKQYTRKMRQHMHGCSSQMFFFDLPKHHRDEDQDKAYFRGIEAKDCVPNPA